MAGFPLGYRNFFRRAAVLLGWGWSLLCGAAGVDDPQALQLLRSSESLMRGAGTEGTYRVRIVRPEWERTLRLKSIDDAQNHRVRMEMLEPRKVRGTIFLKKADRLSMYLPKLRREIAISPAMMQDPWMGSDFNNQDLLEAGALIDSYLHRVVRRDGEGDQSVITIESTPKPDTPVSWMRLEQKIRADGVPVEVRYHCKSGERNRIMRFEEVRTIAGRAIPTRWVMQPLAQPGQHTVIEIEQLHFGVPADDGLFESLNADGRQDG